MIGRSFTLKTDLFEATCPRTHFINERCFGEDFATWLAERLKGLGMTPSSPIQEDWGWAVLVPFRGHKFTLSVGIMDESIGKIPAEWRVGIGFERPLNGIRAWLRASPSAELAELATVIEGILRAEPPIENVAAEP